MMAETILVGAVIVVLLGFIATVMLTCMTLAKTRVVTVMGWVVIGLCALIIVLSLLTVLNLPWFTPYRY